MAGSVHRSDLQARPVRPVGQRWPVPDPTHRRCPTGRPADLQGPLGLRAGGSALL